MQEILGQELHQRAEPMASGDHAHASFDGGVLPARLVSMPRGNTPVLELEGFFVTGDGPAVEIAVGRRGLVRADDPVAVLVPGHADAGGRGPLGIPGPEDWKRRPSGLLRGLQDAASRVDTPVDALAL